MLKYDFRTCVCRKSEGPTEADLDAFRVAQEQRRRSEPIGSTSMNEQQRRAVSALQFAAEKLGLFGSKSLIDLSDIPEA